MAVYAALNCFNAGELSPRMIGRSDVSQYSKGCRKLQNFFVTPYGSAERRPGTEFIAFAKFSDRPTRLIRFVFSSTVAYLCEFGDFYIRFFRDGKSAAAEIVTPYAAGTLDKLQFVQSADVMTIVHPEHPVMELKRVAADTFTLTEKLYEYPPVLEPNLNDRHTLTPSAVSGDITLTASADTFTAGNIGGFFQLIHSRKNNEIHKDFTADGNSTTLEVFGFWTFTTHGTWSGNITIQRSFDGGAVWQDYRTYSSEKDSNVSTSGEEEQKGVIYRIQMKNYAASDTGTLKLCRCLLVNPDFHVTGVVRITAVNNAKSAAGTVVSKLGEAAATAEWNEGAWSVRRGFPRSIAYFEERMFFGGTAGSPQTVWGSKTGDWDNFLVGSKDDDALEFTIASDTVNTICWMSQHQALIIGTMDSEWTIAAADSAAALTPSNFQIKRQSVFGSHGIPALMVGETLLFVQRGARKVREFVFQWEKNGYSSPDMTILADHITSSGIRETALQQLPDSILWCVLNDGTVAALTYERDQQVIGWHRHLTNGWISSVAVLPDGDVDTVYWSARRFGKVCIEKMQPRNISDITKAFFVDAGKTVAGEQLEELAGLEHLEGLTVQILADGAPQREKVVRDGKITLDAPADTVTVGLGYTSILSPMPIELETQNGQSLLRQKAVGALRLRVYNSVGGELRCGHDLWQEIISRDVLADDLDKAVTAKDEVIVLNCISGNDYTPDIEIRQCAPLPLNINSMVAVYDVTER